MSYNLGMAHTFNSKNRRQRIANLCKFKASLLYIASSRTARATQSQKKKRERHNYNLKHISIYNNKDLIAKENIRTSL
jgi:hypothetical protein